MTSFPDSAAQTSATGNAGRKIKIENIRRKFKVLANITSIFRSVIAWKNCFAIERAVIRPDDVAGGDGSVGGIVGYLVWAIFVPVQDARDIGDVLIRPCRSQRPKITASLVDLLKVGVHWSANIPEVVNVATVKDLIFSMPLAA